MKIHKEQDDANIQAAELIGKLYNRLEEIGYDGHPMKVCLVRILFCLFAEDITIFNKQQFQDYIEYRTQEDGSDLESKLQEFFQVLNTPQDKRLPYLGKQPLEFPYVNNKLFEEILPIAGFDANMRKALLECCQMDWSKISPSIFGSIFQSVRNQKERRNFGAHYTSEKNILKLIKPLFLDELYAEFETIKNNLNKLKDFHQKLNNLKFLDPACGCGNFLVITYRELRLLEIEILRAIKKTGQCFLDVREIILLNIGMMHGIEYEEFPACIAEIAIWLVDHQMNMLISNEFGRYSVKLGLKNTTKIICGNALQINWEDLIRKEELSYIIGNPPFIGSRMMTSDQKKDIDFAFQESIAKIGDLDYVTGWYIKAAKFIQGTKIKTAFVSTNSIVQGLQAGLLWVPMIKEYGIKIHFAHQTFKWRNEAGGNAAVYCVIIGFAAFDCNYKLLYDYEHIKGEAPVERKVSNINPYLVDAADILLNRRHHPISNIPEMSFGNMPAEGGEFLFTTSEKEFFISKEPESEPYFRRFIGAYEFINQIEKWCLWLKDIQPDEIRRLKLIMERVERVREIRKKSSRPQLAAIPHLFAQITQPENDYLLIPATTSEHRKYIPIGFFSKDNIVGNSSFAIPNATLYHFGILTSLMHMTWVKLVCGRLENRLRYSKDIVYNNYPFPLIPTEKQKRDVKIAAQNVLDTREMFSDNSLANLYDPITMPPSLVKAHQQLDATVDLCYRNRPFVSENDRMEHLFGLYNQYAKDIFITDRKLKNRNSEQK